MMTQQINGAVPLAKHRHSSELASSFHTLAKRHNLMNINFINFDDLYIISRIDGDFTTVILMYEREGKVYMGAGSSKKSLKDKPFRMRGVIYAANDALEDLDLELGNHNS